MALLNRLIAIGEPEAQKVEDWPHYVEMLGLGEKDIEALIDIATNESLTDSDETWGAPVHAWRALGQMRAVEASEPLISTFSWFMDWAWEELLDVYQLIGVDALPALAAGLKQSNDEQKHAVSLGEIISRIGQVSEEARTQAVAVLMELLGDELISNRDVNGAIVSALVDLKAVEAAELLEKVYAADQVDTSYCGSWAQVQVYLGLRKRSDFSEKELQPLYKDQSPFFRQHQERQRLQEAAETLFSAAQPKREKKVGFGKSSAKKGKKSNKKKR